MFLGPGLCIPPRPEFRRGPIAGTSAGPRVVNKNLFVRSQPRCMAGSLSWCCDRKSNSHKHRDASYRELQRIVSCKASAETLNAASLTLTGEFVAAGDRSADVARSFSRNALPSGGGYPAHLTKHPPVGIMLFSLYVPCMLNG
jgi:hypothetical protein